MYSKVGLDYTMQKFAIHGLPRSGSTWIGEIFNSSPNVCYRYQPLFSYQLKSYLGDSSSRESIYNFFDKLNLVEDDFLNQSVKRNQHKLPTFKKNEITHVCYKEVRYHNILPNMVSKAVDVKFIFIHRNPFSVIHSWLNAPREFRADLGWNPLEEWRYAKKKNLNRPEEFNGYEKWKEASLMFHHLAKQYPDRVKILRYDKLLENTVEHVHEIFDFVELDYTGQTDYFLRRKQVPDGDAYSVRRSRQTDDKWQTKLHPDIIETIQNDLAGSVLNFL